MNDRLIVQGEYINGNMFRPSDWVERLASCFATYADNHRLQYHGGLSPVFIGNNKCLSIDLSLEDSRPDIWSFVMGFVLDNNLKTVVQYNETESSSDDENENLAA